MTHGSNGIAIATLSESSDSGIRIVALSLLAKAESAAKALHESADSLGEDISAGDDALHDFRVALRRLRSWLRAFKSSLRPGLRRKHERRLRSIVRSTNAARDAAVQSTWLSADDSEKRVSSRAGYDVMRSRLGKQREKGVRSVLEAVDEFDRLAPKIKRTLEGNDELFGTLLAEAIISASDQLEKSLSRIRGWDDARREHRARIAAKRLRYLIEPVSKLAAGGDAIVESLKSLQDSFGDLHDVQVFSTELERASKEGTDETEPGLTELSEKSQTRAKDLYEQIEREWLDGSADPFFEKVREFADQLSSAARRS